MEWVETTAKTLEKAKSLALDNLGVDESEAEFEILEEPRQGLFGRTRGEARVRARVRPKAPRAKDESRRRRRPKRSDGPDAGVSTDGDDLHGEGSAGDDTGSTTEREQGDDAPRRERPSRERSSEGRKSARASSGSGKAKTTEDGVSKDAAEDRDSAETARPDQGAKKRQRSRAGSARPEQEESTVDEVTQTVEDFLRGLTEAFGIDAPVTTQLEGDQLLASIEGKHGLLLGPKAHTLDAIQELARVTAQRSAPSSVRIKVDVGGYREARRQALVGFAQAAAARALDEGVEVVLEPMNSADRKTVHDTINAIPGVVTRSAGMEPRRRVVVEPDPAASVSATGEEEE